MIKVFFWWDSSSKLSERCLDMHGFLHSVDKICLQKLSFTRDHLFLKRQFDSVRNLLDHFEGVGLLTCVRNL